MKYRHVFLIAILLSTYIVIGFAGFVGGYNTSSIKPFFSDDRSLASIVLESIDADTRAKRDKEQRDRDQCMDNFRTCKMDHHAAKSLVETTDIEWKNALIEWKKCEVKLRAHDNLPK